jgi:hypothetical protein
MQARACRSSANSACGSFPSSGYVSRTRKAPPSTGWTKGSPYDNKIAHAAGVSDGKRRPDRLFARLQARHPDDPTGHPPPPAGLRGLPENRRDMGAFARLFELRPCRLLRCLTSSPRDGSPQAHSSSDDRVGRGRRNVGLLLRRRSISIGGVTAGILGSTCGQSRDLQARIDHPSREDLIDASPGACP